MKTLIAFLIFFIYFIPAQSQQYFADYVIVGTSLTYINYNDLGNYNSYNEFTWNVNVGIRLSESVLSGLQILNIYSSEFGNKKDYYSVYGLFTQYDFLKKNANRLFAEISFDRGNYCTCNNIPRYGDNLYYIGWGGGFEYQIKKIPNLYLDLSFIVYNILNKIEDKYGYTQYIIGLNYRLNSR